MVLCITTVVNCDYHCDDNPLYIYGQVPSSITRIFTSATPAYELERKKFGKNVFIETIQIFNQVYDDSETVDEATEGNPILFSISDRDRQLHNNEIKFPVVVS